MMMQLMQLMLQMMQMVMSLLGGQNRGPQFSRALPGDAGNAGNAGNVGNAGNAGRSAALAPSPIGLGTGPINPTANAENDPQLQQSLQAIAQDPEGRRLLEMAQRNGVRISTGNPGGPNVLGVFIQRGNDRQIIVRDGSNIKTIVHELVHAATIEDGNSQHEEGIANIIGDRVAARVTGRQAGNPNQIYNRTLPLYQDLQRFNGIEQSLGRLGIVA